MKAKNYFKRVVATLLAIALLLPASGVGKFEATNEKKFNIKVYSSFSGNLIEWTKVKGASAYTVYRKTGNKKNKKYSKKWQKIAKITDKWFHDNGNPDNAYKRRFFIDTYTNYICDKKNIKGCNIDKHSYKYCVVAKKGNAKTKKNNSKTVKRKSYKSNKNKALVNYGLLDRVNKERHRKKLNVLVWEHSFEDGTKIRACDNYYLQTKNKKISHSRPDEMVTAEIKKTYGLDFNSAFLKYRAFTNNFCDIECGENVSRGSKIREIDKLFNAYVKSTGHYAQMTDSSAKYFVSYSKNTNEVSTFFYNTYTKVSEAYNETIGENARSEKDKKITISQEKKEKIMSLYITGECSARVNETINDLCDSLFSNLQWETSLNSTSSETEFGAYFNTYIKKQAIFTSLTHVHVSESVIYKNFKSFFLNHLNNENANYQKLLKEFQLEAINSVKLF